MTPPTIAASMQRLGLDRTTYYRRLHRGRTPQQARTELPYARARTAVATLLSAMQPDVWTSTAVLQTQLGWSRQQVLAHLHEAEALRLVQATWRDARSHYWRRLVPSLREQ